MLGRERDRMRSNAYSQLHSGLLFDSSRSHRHYNIGNIILLLDCQESLLLHKIEFAKNTNARAARAACAEITPRRPDTVFYIRTCCLFSNQETDEKPWIWTIIMRRFNSQVMVVAHHNDSTPTQLKATH